MVGAGQIQLECPLGRKASISGGQLPALPLAEDHLLGLPCAKLECSVEIVLLFSRGCGAGVRLAIERGFLVIHESGTCVKFTQTGAELFA